MSGIVNTNLLGSYSITYNATDTAGNIAIPVTRTVNVVPTTVSGGGTSSGGGSSQENIIRTIIATSTATTTPSQGKVLGLATFKFNQDLRLRMKNNDVMELQKRLAAEGYFTIAPTGYFGTLTLRAVKMYQASHGIKPVSGFVGPITRAVLNK
jgi:hypothetical protein